MDRSWAHGLPNLALYPAPLLEAAVVSDIGNSRFVPKNDPLYHSARQRLWRQIERARMRMLKARRLLDRCPPHPLRSEEHTSELQSLMRIPYAVLRVKTKIG